MVIEFGTAVYRFFLRQWLYDYMDERPYNGWNITDERTQPRPSTN